jgi:heme-degrading monooxygenase HmoA
MKHLRLGLYELGSGTFDEVAAIAAGPDGMAQVFRGSPGFISYGLVNCTDGTIASVSVWETAAEAEAASGAARDWVNGHIADRVRLLSSKTGDFGFIAGATLVVA